MAKIPSGVQEYLKFEKHHKSPTYLLLTLQVKKLRHKEGCGLPSVGQSGELADNQARPLPSLPALPPATTHLAIRGGPGLFLGVPPCKDELGGVYGDPDRRGAQQGLLSGLGKILL